MANLLIPDFGEELGESKYAFMLFFPLIVLPVTGSIGYVLFQPSLRATLTLAFEAIFMVFSLGALSLSNGIKGADFAEVPWPRMILVEWGLINSAHLPCGSGGTVLAPLRLYAIPTFIWFSLGPYIELCPAVLISAVIAAV